MSRPPTYCRLARIAAGYTIEEAAKLRRLKPSTYALYERTARFPPHHWDAYARAFGCPCWYFRPTKQGGGVPLPRKPAKRQPRAAGRPT